MPVDNFYEWAKTGTGKQPYAIALADRKPMALAGLWENWKSPEGEWIRSFAIVTTTPNELCARLHQAGWRTVVLPVAKATHRGSASASILGRRAKRLPPRCAREARERWLRSQG